MKDGITISEIYGTVIQGEGAVIGKPTVFVRTGGCDYRCSWSVSPETHILLADYSEKPARDVRAGDEILGLQRGEFPNGYKRGKQSYIERTSGPYRSGLIEASVTTPGVEKVRVSFTDGRTVDVTPDHAFVLYEGSYGGRMKKALDLAPGDRVRAFLPYESVSVDHEYQLGYLAGAADDDGSFRTFKGKYPRFAIACSDGEVIDRFREYAGELGFTLRSGQHLSGGQFAPARYIPCLRLSTSSEVDRFRKLLSEDPNSLAFWRGYFAGIYDTDGSTDGSTLRIAQKKQPQRERILKCLVELGLDYREETKTIRVAGGCPTLRKLLLECRPALGRKTDSFFLSLGGHESYAVVEDVEAVEPGEIVSIQTSLGTYVSNGILNRNCDSKFAVLPEHRDEWRRMGAEEVFGEVRRLSPEPVLITLSGGNPALQPLGELVRLGKEAGYTFAIETQGTISRDWFAEMDYLTLSPKPPSSGMPTDWKKLGKCAEAGGENTLTLFKVVVFDEEDYAYAREVARHFPEIPMYLQVGNDTLEGEPDIDVLLRRYVWLSEKVLGDGWNGATVLPQLHVLAHGNRRGV